MDGSLLDWVFVPNMDTVPAQFDEHNAKMTYQNALNNKLATENELMNAVENILQGATGKIDLSVFPAIAKGSVSGTSDGLEIGLECGKYTLSEKFGKLLLAEVKGKGREIAWFDGSLDVFKQKLKEKIPVPQTPLEEDWQLVGRSNTGVTEQDTGIEFELVDDEASRTPLTFPAYLDLAKLNIPTGERGFSTEICQFFKRNYPDLCASVPDARNQIYHCSCLTLYPVCVDSSDALQFIAEHKNDEKLVLLPYVAKNRTVGEDHVVVVAMMDGEARIFDPKSGIDLGRDIEKCVDKKISALWWQAPLDTTNCAFFAYHLVTTAVIASEKGDVGFTESVEKFKDFFTKSSFPKPQVIAIKQEMRDIWEAIDPVKNKQ